MPKRILRAAVFPLIIFALNCYFAKDLFRLEYSQFMGSIEAAYISISRYMIANWRDLTWFPLWYGGIPFQNSYPPLLHAIVAVTSVVAGWSPARSHHAVTAFFYCLGPVTLYALALRLTASRWSSFWAAWIYSILSPCAFLMPLIRADLGGWFGLRRYQALVPYGEGPHITSMALLPIALLALDLAIAKRTPIRCVFAAVAMAVVALTNWLGTFALAIAVFAYLMARPQWRTWLAAFCLGALAYAFACPWIPPSTIRDVQHNAQTIGGSFEHVYRVLPLYLAGGVLVALALRRMRISAVAQFFTLFAILTSVIPLAAEWFNIAIVPQPLRYHLEMDVALSLAAVFAIRPFTKRLPRSYAAALVLLLFLASFFPARFDRRYARLLTKPIDIFQTTEYRAANWFEQHLDGGRVMAAGTVSYWMNAFTDTPQLGGGFDQGIVNRNNTAVTYQILSADGAGDRAADIARLWLRAFGVQAIAVQQSQPYRHPENFQRSFPPAFRNNDLSIYWVPERTPSLAYVLDAKSLVRDRPINGIDIAQTQAYVQALTVPASFRWTSRHSAEIQAEIHRPQLISFQVTYHPGWRATANGTPARVFADGLGQIAIDPNCDGACSIHLTFDGGWEMRIARWLCWLAVLGCGLWILVPRPTLVSVLK